MAGRTCQAWAWRKTLPKQWMLYFSPAQPMEDDRALSWALSVQRFKKQPLSQFKVSSGKVALTCDKRKNKKQCMESGLSLWRAWEYVTRKSTTLIQGWFWPEEVASTLLSDLCLKAGHKFVFEKFSLPPIPHPTLGGRKATTITRDIKSAHIWVYSKEPH